MIYTLLYTRQSDQIKYLFIFLSDAISNTGTAPVTKFWNQINNNTSNFYLINFIFYNNSSGFNFTICSDAAHILLQKTLSLECNGFKLGKYFPKNIPVVFLNFLEVAKFIPAWAAFFGD